MSEVGVLFWTQLWQVTLVILVVGFISLRFGRRYPHLTFLLWMLVVVKTLFPPVLSSPASMFSWLDTAASSWPDDVARSNLEPDYFVPDQRQIELPTEANRAQYAGSFASSEIERYGSSGTISHNWKVILTAIWALGALTLFSATVFHWVRFSRRLRTHRVATPLWVESLIERVQFSLGIKRQFRVVVNSQGIGPLVYGVVRPTLVLPLELLEVERRRRLEPVVAHEMIHARRGDTLFSLVQFVAQLVWWFHPLVWWAQRQANQCCEQCCDEEVVAGLKCKPEEYAHALLDVLELRKRLRPVPMLSGVRSREVTARRLKALVFRQSPFARRAPRWHWPVLLIAGLLILPGARLARGWDDDFGTTPSVFANYTLRNKADEEFAQRRWNEAVFYYKELLQRDEEDARSWFRMSYALHASGRLEEAVIAHRKAATFEQIRPIATYNLACALALLGCEDEAMEKLEEAVELGFRSQLPIQNDTDLEKLVNRPGFRELAKRSLPDGELSVYKQFDFWIGHWNVFDKDGAKIGSNVVTKDERGLVLIENWKGLDGSNGQSKTSYDPTSEVWKQEWIDTEGTTFEFEGQYDDGKMVLTGEGRIDAATRVLCRMVFVPMPNGMIRQVIERSMDDGETWSTDFDGLYDRVPGSLNRLTGDREEVSIMESR